MSDEKPGFAVTLTEAWVALQNENALLLAKLDRQRVDADLARRDLKRVSDWHRPSTHEDEAGLCGGCGGHWPCHTRRILDGYFHPAYGDARCGQRSVHAPHISDTGPDQPRNCPGVPVPTFGHAASCVAGVTCEPYCEATS